MCAKKLHYAAGDDLMLYATPEEAMRAGRRKAEEEKYRKQQKYEMSKKYAKQDTRIHSAPPVLKNGQQSSDHHSRAIPAPPISSHQSRTVPQHPVKSSRVPPPDLAGSSHSGTPTQSSRVSSNHNPPTNFNPVYSSAKSTQSNTSIRSSEEERDNQIATKLFYNHDIRKRGRLTGEELQNILQNDDNTHFCISAVNSLINLFGASRFGTINQQEFTSLYKRVKSWRKIYVDNDINHSFTLSSSEFHNAIQELGYQIPYEIGEKLFDQYAEFINQNVNGKELKFDRFVESLVWLMRLTKTFRKFDDNQVGLATIQYKDFIETVLYLGRFLPN